MKINWQVKNINEALSDELSTSLGFSRYLSSILLTRGINSLKEAYHYLNPRMSTLLSPFLMKGMYDAVGRIRRAVSENQRIGIFADSDLDGLTSLTIILRLLQKMGVNPCYRYAVENEDYGLRMEVIDEFREKNTDLIITLDCGIRDVEEIARAREYGMDVIVCDHHEQGLQIPDAVIVNPKQNECAYPFKELAGVGVAFKLCHGILMSYSRSFNKHFLIIIKDGGCFSYSFIKNGIVEEMQKVYQSGYFGDLALRLQDDDNIILYDLGEDQGLIRGQFKGFRIYDFSSLFENFNGAVVSRDIAIDDLCALFSLSKEAFDSKIDIVNAVFFEIELNNSPKIREFIDSIIDLVSVGTIADIMPMKGENRTIVHHGVKSINSTNHPGLSIIVGGLNNEVSTKQIAWDISPLLNTPGRFGKTDLTARFFLEEDDKRLRDILSEINLLNNKRKKLTTELFNDIMKDIEESGIADKTSLVFIQSPNIPEGLCGLLANRLTDSTGKPVIVVSLMGDKELVKGSGRSIGDLNFFSYVEPFSGLFVKIGGHQKAFGFTAKCRDIETIREKIEHSLCNYNNKSSRNFDIDMELPVDVIDFNFINSLSMFEPYGYENEECTFLTRNAGIRDFKRFGNDNNHGKYTFNDNRFIEAIGWNMASRMEECFSRKKLDIIYKLENNVFNGRISPRMLILDID